MLVNMNKVQRKYDLAQHALGWQRQRIEGWRLAARLDDDDRLVSVRGSAWHFSEFLVVEDDNTLTLPRVEGATLIYAAVYGESPHSPRRRRRRHGRRRRWRRHRRHYSSSSCRSTLSVY